jgi:hypothetical protein
VQTDAIARSNTKFPQPLGDSAGFAFEVAISNGGDAGPTAVLSGNWRRTQRAPEPPGSILFCPPNTSQRLGAFDPWLLSLLGTLFIVIQGLVKPMSRGSRVGTDGSREGSDTCPENWYLLSPFPTRVRRRRRRRDGTVIRDYGTRTGF